MALPSLVTSSSNCSTLCIRTSLNRIVEAAEKGSLDEVVGADSPRLPMSKISALPSSPAAFAKQSFSRYKFVFCIDL